LIDRLEARGLVTRQPSSEDRRVKHVVLTADGEELRDELLERVGRPTAGFERLSADELAQLAGILRRVLDDGNGTAA
jgi:DNA-binding MarR family transcriptional regulator